MNKKNTRAFTLIELLVVVLIIGVLAAVALPQYQTAVNKSRYAGLMPIAKSIKDAEEEMKMATGHYTADLNDLSVQVPGIIREGSEGAIADLEDGTVVELYSAGEHDFVKVSRTNLPNTYVMYFDKSPTFAGGIHCEAANTGDQTARAKQLCLSYGPSNPAAPITGTDSAFDAYVLQGDTSGTGSGFVAAAPRVTVDSFDAGDWDCGTDDCFVVGENPYKYSKHNPYDPDDDPEEYAEYNSYRYIATRICASWNEDEECDEWSNKIESYLTDTYDKDGNAIETIYNCSGWNEDGSCNAYSSASINTYDSTLRNQTAALRCSDVSSDGVCNQYSSGTYYTQDTIEDPVTVYLPSHSQNITTSLDEVKTTAFCSNFTGTTCNTYSSMIQKSSPSVSLEPGPSTQQVTLTRSCKTIVGITCQEWNEWQQNY